MTYREAFEAWKNRSIRVAGEYVPMWQTWGPGEERIALEAWQAALASERAKQAEPVTLHIDDAECVMYAALRAAHERGPVSDDKVLLDELAKRGVSLCRAAPPSVQAELVADNGPWFVGNDARGGRTYIQSDDFSHDARLYIDGDFASDAQREEYAASVAKKLNAAPPAVQAEPVAVGHDGKPWPHTIDAKAWADEFCRVNTASDNGTMIGWFANAIEFARAYDAAPPAVQAEPVARAFEDCATDESFEDGVAAGLHERGITSLTAAWMAGRMDFIEEVRLTAACTTYAAPPADDGNARLLTANRDLKLHFDVLKSDYDEAVRLLREARISLHYAVDCELIAEIDAYLARVGK